MASLSTQVPKPSFSPDVCFSLTCTLLWSDIKSCSPKFICLVGKLSEEDVREMLTNMKLAAPEDVALVKLLSKWAKRARRSSPEPQVAPQM